MAEGRGVGMIRCPNCGSTAQVKVFYGDNLNNIWIGSTGLITQHLTCGCGYEFVRHFKYDKTEIIKRGE